MVCHSSRRIAFKTRSSPCSLRADGYCDTTFLPCCPRRFFKNGRFVCRVDGALNCGFLSRQCGKCCCGCFLSYRSCCCYIMACDVTSGGCWAGSAALLDEYQPVYVHQQLLSLLLGVERPGFGWCSSVQHVQSYNNNVHSDRSIAMLAAGLAVKQAGVA